MRAFYLLVGVCTALLVPGVAVARASAAVQPSALHVTLDQSEIFATVGDTLTLGSNIVNSGSAPTDPLVAHINVASLDGSYVDLEDWSADVTRTVPPIAPGRVAALSWEFQAVNTGMFDVYVVVLPNAGGAASEPLIASPPVHVTVAGRRTLSGGGALPVVIAIPLLIGIVALGIVLRRFDRPLINRRS